MSNPFLSVINASLPEPHASLLNGILFGVRTDIPTSVYDSMVSTGTVHMIALSGLNISILINLIARFTLGLGRKRSIEMTIVLIGLFVWFVGASPSIVRAGLMGSMSLIGVYLGKKSWSLLSLLITAGIMLAIDIQLVSDLSFQLSFLATLGIVLMDRPKNNKPADTLLKRCWDPIREDLKVTLSAQLFTIPVIWYHFHRISVISPIANVLIGWTMPPIMALGLVLAFAGTMWKPLGIVIGWAEWVLLSYVIGIVRILSRFPFASVTW